MPIDQGVDRLFREASRQRVEPTGFENRTTSSLSFVDGTRTFTITGNFWIWSAGNRYLKGTESVSFANTVGLWFISYPAGGGALQASQTPWNLLSGTVPVAIVYWDGTRGYVQEERHGITMDKNTHNYLHQTIGTRYSFGLTGTFADASFSITVGSIFDEDIEIGLGSQTTCRLFYRSGANYVGTVAQAKPFSESGGGVIQYDNAGTLTEVDPAGYVASWVFATNDVSVPIWVVVGQRQDTTLANARANNTLESLALSSLPSKEMKLLYRVIYRRNGTSETYTEAADYRSSSNVPVANYTPTAHSSLSGLLNDDHTQYLLLAGRSGQTVADAVTISTSTRTPILYFGDPTVDGTWRLTVDSGSLVAQLRVSSAWVTQFTFSS